jgi:hypothetical protein
MDFRTRYACAVVPLCVHHRADDRHRLRCPRLVGIVLVAGAKTLLHVMNACQNGSNSEPFTILVGYMQNNLFSSEPVLTDKDGKAVIAVSPPDSGGYDSYGDGGYFSEVVGYIATAETADGRLMLVDLGSASVYGGPPGGNLLSEVFVDRTVVGPGTASCKSITHSTPMLL